MKWENEYGKMIAYEHKLSSITASQLCEGLCSKENLRKIKEGSRVCDKILADALLQRLGVSMDKFSYLTRMEEWEEIRIREKIVFLVDRNQKEKARQVLKRYKTQLKGKHILFVQFYELASVVLEWKSGERIEKIQQRLQKAWNFTKKGKAFQIEQGECYSFFELSFIMLKIRLLEERGIREDEVEYGIEQYQNLLIYLENQVFEQDRVKWYPQVAYRQIKLLRKKGKLEQAIEIAEKSLGLLKDQASLNYLLEILEEYTKLLKIRFLLKEERISKEIERRLADIDLICESLRWLYQKYKVKSTEWIWYISFGLSEMYLCQDIVRGRRIGMGMTQEELAEGICDPVTISRIERGESFPQQKILIALLQKLKWSGNHYTLTAQIGEPRYHAITSRISMLTHTERFEEAEELLKELERKVKERTIFAEQYFLSMSSIAYQLGKIDAETCLKLHKKALYLTMPEKMTEEQLKHWYFSRMEVMCINEISYLCKEIGKEEELIKLLFVIKQFYERQPFPLRYYRAGYELTMRNIGNLLGNIGKDKEAIEAEEACISLALNLQKAGNLSAALYDKGWDMERLWKEQLYTKEESFAYIKASYAFNLFLGKKKQYEHIRTHIEEVYKEKIL